MFSELCLIFSELLCPELPKPYDGNVSWTGLTPGSTAEYICFTGFKPNGNTMRTCEIGGIWSGQEPTCLKGITILSKSRNRAILFLLLISSEDSETLFVLDVLGENHETFFSSFFRQDHSMFFFKCQDILITRIFYFVLALCSSAWL